MNLVYVDLTEDHPGKIYVWFQYAPEIPKLISKVTGSKFVPKDKGGPYWLCPLDFAVAQELREVFGETLVVGDDLKSWGIKHRRQAEKLQTLSAADDAECPLLYETLPELHGWLRGYQRAGAAFIAATDGSLIADQPGLGKTAQTIAGIYEAGADEGAHIVVAPVVALETVWQRELERWQPHPVWVPTGSRAQRDNVVEDFFNYVTNIGGPGWLVVNPDMVANYREAPKCSNCGLKMVRLKPELYYCAEDELYDKPLHLPQYPLIHEIDWMNAVIDECHKNAVRNPTTLTAEAMFKLQVQAKTVLMSGTPVANKPIDLWGMLHMMDPVKFSSKWRWAGQWLEITNNNYGKVIGGIRADRKEAFFKSLAPYVLRRTLGEVFSELPPAQHIDLWAEMESKQKKQYITFAKDAQVKIDTEELSATEKIVEYLRLKQFAIATQNLVTEGDGDERKVVPYPTFDSCKLRMVEELLEERGILDKDGDEKVVIFSQWERVVDMVLDWLHDRKIPALKLVGRTPRKKEVQDRFQAMGGPRVIVMTTETGGISITLDRANTCIFTDETWLASTMEQAVSRLRPQGPSRMDRPEDVVFAYYIRTKGTIDEYIMDVVFAKGETAEEILDKRRLQLY